MTVMIGIDPHKRTHKAVALGERDEVLDQIRVIADRRQLGYPRPTTRPRHTS